MVGYPGRILGEGIFYRGASDPVGRGLPFREMYWREKVTSAQWQPVDKLTCSRRVWLLYRLDCLKSYVSRALSEGVLTYIFRSVTTHSPKLQDN